MSNDPEVGWSVLFSTLTALRTVHEHDGREQQGEAVHALGELVRDLEARHGETATAALVYSLATRHVRLLEPGVDGLTVAEYLDKQEMELLALERRSE